jgi:hypothetical protein
MEETSSGVTKQLLDVYPDEHGLQSEDVQVHVSHDEAPTLRNPPFACCTSALNSSTVMPSGIMALSPEECVLVIVLSWKMLRLVPMK